jgi:hypothetical protein
MSGMRDAALKSIRRETSVRNARVSAVCVATRFASTESAACASTVTFAT